MSAPTTETHAIVNGTAATVTSYPAVVAVLVNNGVCSGVVIAPKLVLTAASCLDPGIHGLPDQQAITNNTTVLVGSVDLNAAGGTTIAAAATAVHPSYAFSSTGNPAALHDVGVVTLGSAAPGATPLPIDVSTGSALGLSVIQVGFGATRFNSSGAPDFASVGRESSVSKTVADCQIVIGASANATNLCYDQSDKKGFCSGDSGGPSIAQIQAVNTVVAFTRTAIRIARSWRSTLASAPSWRSSGHGCASRTAIVPCPAARARCRSTRIASSTAAPAPAGTGVVAPVGRRVRRAQAV